MGNDPRRGPPCQRSVGTEPPLQMVHHESTGLVRPHPGVAARGRLRRFPLAAAAALIDEACGIKGNILVSGDGQTYEDVSIFLARFCFRGQRRQDWEREYFEVYYPHDERLPRRRDVSRQAELVRLVLSLSELPRRRS